MFASDAERAGLRRIGIDRPGYGGSTSQPGRTIGGWVPEALAVVDHLGIDRFVAAGASTGGAYALALAASSARVLAAVACCAVSDMRWREGRAMIPEAVKIWDAPNREAAHQAVVALFGEDGSKVTAHSTGDAIAASDRAVLADPQIASAWIRSNDEAFVQGVDGFTDDRLADGNGWSTFDVRAIKCPVIVLHGTSDTIVPVAHAYHTAALVPGATLRVVEGLGHFSIILEIIGGVTKLLAQSASGRSTLVSR